MQIIFSTEFGCHSKNSVIVNTATLINVTDPDQALEKGWLIEAKNSAPVWYQSRSTRVKLARTNYEYNNEFEFLPNNYDVVELDKIYTKYCDHKHYKKYFEVNSKLESDRIIGYFIDNKLTAWTKLRSYSEKSIESVLFVWDYSHPETHLGIKSLRSEIAWAKQQGYEYFYMGPGYEKNSIYKSDVDGFEWWTGSEWSTDINKYRYLCKRDSHVASYHQIHSVLANLQPYQNNP